MITPFYLLQVIICSGVLFLYYHLALRNRLFHQWNRFYLLAAVVLSLALPAIDWKVDRSEEGVVPMADFVMAVTEVRSTIETASIDTTNQFAVSDFILPVYICVSLLLFVLLIGSLGKIVKLIIQGKRSKVEGVNFVNTDSPGTPFSFFRFIFWNSKIDLRSPTGTRILRHELVHVREWHSLDKLFMQFILMLCWMNPFFWLIRTELRSIHEFIADQKSTGDKGGNALAEMILQSSYPGHSSFITNQFFNTSIKRRIAMITKPQSRVSYFTRMFALPVIAFIAFAFTVKSNEQLDNVHNVEITNSDRILINSTSTPKETNQPVTVPFISGTEDNTTDEPLISSEAELGPLDSNRDGMENSNTDGTATKDTVPTFVKVQTEASIDPVIWNEFLLKQLPVITMQAENNGFTGTVTKTVRLLIDREGKVTEAIVVDDKGWIAQRLQKAMLLSPQWRPAEQNGRKVSSYVNQPVTLILTGRPTPSTYPSISPEDLKKLTLQQMVGVKEEVEVISCTIAMDLPNGDIIEVRNTGNTFSGSSLKLIEQAQKGLMLTVDAIVVKDPNGGTIKMPSRLFKM